MARERRREAVNQGAKAQVTTLAVISLIFGLASAALFSLSAFGIFPLSGLALPVFRSTDLRLPVLAGSSALLAVVSGLVARLKARGSHGIPTELATGGLILGMVWFALVLSFTLWSFVCGGCGTF